MVRSRRSRWFIAFASAVGAGALPAAGAADTGGVPVDPPACISVLPTLTITCPQPAPPQPQTANPVSAQSTQSQAGPSSVSAIPDLARSLLAEVNRTRRMYGLRPLAYSAPLANAATEHSKALATAGMFTHSWPTTGPLIAGCS